MDSKIKARWLAALRSGDYLQARGFLRSARGYCCLGVLCEIAVQEGVTTRVTRGEGAESYYGEDFFSTVLPEQVSDWAGGLSSSGALPGEATIDGSFSGNTLADLNDSGRYTFEQIADVIEEYF